MYRGRQPFFHLFTLSPLKGVSHFFTFSPFHPFTFSPFPLFTFKTCLLLVLNQQNLGIEQKNTHYLQVYSETFTNFASSKVSTAHYEKRNYKKNVCQGKGRKSKFACTFPQPDNATFEQQEKNILYKNILNRTSLWLTLLVTIVLLAAPVCPNAPLKQSLRAIFIRLTQTLAPSVAHALVFVPARLSACRKEQTN